jgi:septal ring factor EnvC (AmiA/AmiB activator)
MKNATIVLALVCVCLAAALYFRHRGANREITAARKEITTRSNHVAELQAKLDSLEGLRAVLATNLAQRTGDLGNFSNRLVKTKADLQKAAAAAEAAQGQTQERDARIRDLMSARAGLDRTLEDQKAAAESVSRELAAALNLLEASEGDRAFLVQTVFRLEVERKRLLDQFNDRAAVQAQFKKLRTQEVISKRAQMASRGSQGPGAQQLTEQEAPRIRDRSYKLELQEDGSVKVVRQLNRAPNP